jgi:hypothetical protein
VDTTTDLNNDAESAPLAKGQTITFPDGAAPRNQENSERATISITGLERATRREPSPWTRR